MSAIKKNSALRYLLRAPVYLYRWHLGQLLGKRFMLLTHIGRRTGQPHQTVLEVMEYRKTPPEAIVMSGFGRNSDWLLNLQVNPHPEVDLGSQHFIASYRFLGEDESVQVVANYELQNWFMAPIVRYVLSRLLGWTYRGSEDERRRLVHQLPLLAFRPVSSDRNSQTIPH